MTVWLPRTSSQNTYKGFSNDEKSTKISEFI